MSAWAYRCHPCVEGEAGWFVSQLDVEQLAPDVRIVRVRVGRNWTCALLDRTQPVVVEDQLLRDVIASNEADCPECAALLAAATSSPIARAMASAPSAGSTSASPDSPLSAAHIESGKHAMKVQAAAISLQTHQFVVVVSQTALVASPGEADMAIDDLRLYFSGVPVVLMAQQDDGSPSYYGDSQLVKLLAGIPIDKMPWKEYPIG
jgi:hypothetical protein